MNAENTLSAAQRETSDVLAAAMAHHAAGRLEAAEQDYLEVLDRNYRLADILPLVAGLAKDRNDTSAALQHWTRLLQLQPSNVFALLEKGSLLHRLERWHEAAECLEAAHRIDPRHALALSNLGVVLADAGRRDEALKAFRKLAKLQPDNVLARHQVRRMSSALAPFWHIPMLNDAPRNEAFEAGIIKAVAHHGPHARILDIGAGSGLLSMMAARAGAQNIVCCEAVEVISELAQEIIAANGYDQSIKAISKRSQEIILGQDMDQRADILISEIISSDLLSENVLGTFEDALARLVSENATIVPRSVTARGCLIASDVLQKYAFVGEVSGFDISRFTRLASQRLPVHGAMTPWRRLTDDHDLLTLDLRQRWHQPEMRAIPMPINRDGVAVGVLQWLSVDVTDGVQFENPPETYSDGGWLQVVHTFPRPIEVTAGQTFDLVSGHDRTSLVLMPADA